METTPAHQEILNIKAMIDIGKQTIEIDCPSCKRKVKATFKQAADEVKVTCNCGQVIQLEDKNGTCKKAINDVNKAFKDLEKTFKSLGR